MDIIIYTFFMILGIYYLITYSRGKEAKHLVAVYDETIAKKKIKRGKIGGSILIVIAVLGYILCLF
jgi:hypothetical protein